MIEVPITCPHCGGRVYHDGACLSDCATRLERQRDMEASRLALEENKLSVPASREEEEQD